MLHLHVQLHQKLITPAAARVRRVPFYYTLFLKTPENLPFLSIYRADCNLVCVPKPNKDWASNITVSSLSKLLHVGLSRNTVALDQIPTVCQTSDQLACAAGEYVNSYPTPCSRLLMAYQDLSTLCDWPKLYKVMFEWSSFSQLD